jgi:excisionase family DNA binding protein
VNRTEEFARLGRGYKWGGREGETKAVKRCCEMENSTRAERLLTARESAQYLGLALGTLYHMVSEHRIPVIHLSSRCIRFRLSDLERWLDALTRPAKGEF